MSLRYASITVELREVFLANKPEAMLMLSAKGTVPVLQLDSQVLDESLDIMYWALRQADREQWLRPELEAETLALITENDGSFKTASRRQAQLWQYVKDMFSHIYETPGFSPRAANTCNRM